MPRRSRRAPTPTPLRPSTPLSRRTRAPRPARRPRPPSASCRAPAGPRAPTAPRGATGRPRAAGFPPGEPLFEVRRPARHPPGQAAAWPHPPAPRHEPRAPTPTPARRDRSTTRRHPAAAPVGDRALENQRAGYRAAHPGRERFGDLAWAEGPLEGGGRDEDNGGHERQDSENEKPPELPQGVIACRTPCALEPDVSEANSFSQIGRALQTSGSRAISTRETLGFAPRRRRRFALFESSVSIGRQERCPVVTTVTSIASHTT